MASVWVPFTSESKEAIARYPEILSEIKLALQACGRKLALHLKGKAREAEASRKRGYIETYIPHISLALKSILGCEVDEMDLSDRLVEMLRTGGIDEKAEKEVEDEADQVDNSSDSNCNETTL
jgi:DNA topoisomerase-6 subunit B